MRRPVLLLLVAVCLPLSLHADVIELRTGQKIEGEVLKEAGGELVVDIGVDIIRVPHQPGEDPDFDRKEARGDGHGRSRPVLPHGRPAGPQRERTLADLRRRRGPRPDAQRPGLGFHRERPRLLRDQLPRHREGDADLGHDLRPGGKRIRPQADRRREDRRPQPVFRSRAAADPQAGRPQVPAGGAGEEERPPRRG